MSTHEELTDDELEYAAAGKDAMGNVYSLAGRVGLIVNRATIPGAGARAGLGSFGSPGRIGSAFAAARGQTLEKDVVTNEDWQTPTSSASPAGRAAARS